MRQLDWIIIIGALLVGVIVVVDFVYWSRQIKQKRAQADEIKKQLQQLRGLKVKTREVRNHHIMNPSQFCKVVAEGDSNRGGACAVYTITAGSGEDCVEVKIPFQDGHPGEVGYNGILDSALVAVVIDRLLGFQLGPWPSRETTEALRHLEEALMWMDKRVADRTQRGVMNTDNK